MQNIQPITLWYNGQLVTATQLEVVSVYDDLASTADFRYTLFTVDKLIFVSDRLTISGEDYTTWGASADINLAAYEWVAAKLNLVIDHTPVVIPVAEESGSVADAPVTETPVTETPAPVVEEPPVTGEEGVSQSQGE